MADLTVNTSRVRALDGSIVVNKKLGGAAAPGDSVYIASDGDVERTDANAAATADGKGVIISILDNVPGGKTSGVAGDQCTVCVLGRVAGISGTPGARAWVSANAGKLADAAPSGAGSWTRSMGYQEDDDIFFVAPGMEAPVSNS